MAKGPRKSTTANSPRVNPPRLSPPRRTGIPAPPPDRRNDGRRPQITTFEQLLVDGLKKGQIPARSREARMWFRNKAARIKAEPGSLMEQDSRKLVGYPKIGRMYLFQYDPKHKATLPYYDTFPLIFPIEPAKGGFLGINLHYLPPVIRAKLMDALYDLTVMPGKPYDEKTYLGLSYQLLKKAAKYKAFAPCIKHYLAPHVRSRFMLVDAVEWDIAMMLPLARFKKASQETVWRDSREIING
jgi:hypothetical protein